MNASWAVSLIDSGDISELQICILGKQYSSTCLSTIYWILLPDHILHGMDANLYT